MKNIQIPGANERPILLDVYPGTSPRGWIIFAHGVKGFKDWGHWWLLGQNFAAQGYPFIAFNYSHNGTTPEDRFEIADTTAFSENTHSKELSDLNAVINWALQQPEVIPEPIRPNLFLIGHSRSGPICLSQTTFDPRVAGVVTWGAVASLAYAWPDDQFLENWKTKGFYSMVNYRTRQVLQINYALYEDFQANSEKLDIDLIGSQLHKPYLIVHGDQDEAVPVEAAHRLKALTPDSRISIIPGGDHVFGGRHPWTDQALPPASNLLLEVTLEFLNANSPIR